MYHSPIPPGSLLPRQLCPTLYGLIFNMDSLNSFVPLPFTGSSLTCAVATEDLQVGKVLDVRGGACHGEQSGQVGIGRVGGKTQSSAQEMNSGLTSETLCVE